MLHTPFSQISEDLTPIYGEGEARSIARIVVEDAFGGRPYQTFLCTSEAEHTQLADIRAQLLQGIPVQYVLRMADFYGLKYKVNPAVLIPRQETEELVATVLGFIPPPPTAVRLLDIGLGSGCIGITLAYKRREIQLFGFEKSPEALLVAQENADRLLGPGKADFRLADILNMQPTTEQFDMIVSNPPYIPRHEAALIPLHVLDHEPELALFVDDPDPLLFYRKIAQYARQTLATSGMLFFECNQFNATEVVALLEQEHFQHIQLLKDLSGADRIVRATYYR